MSVIPSPVSHYSRIQKTHSPGRLSLLTVDGTHLLPLSHSSACALQRRYIDSSHSKVSRHPCLSLLSTDLCVRFGASRPHTASPVPATGARFSESKQNPLQFQQSSEHASIEERLSSVRRKTLIHTVGSECAISLAGFIGG
jgi:hypothetical protein